MKKIMKKFIAYILIICELFQGTGVYALTKEENVYVKLKENGEVQSTSVIEHLWNYNENTINDKTILSNIKNVNGNEKFTQNGNDLIWETTGKDIYYQGTYKEDLPISLDVKYYLNGEEKPLNEILGKKGNIKIALTYHNNSYKQMNINGINEKIYVPYWIVTTTVLNNKDNKNIQVTNGKVIDNGVGSVIMAISSPGLSESLKLEELREMNKVEIMYDTEAFELNSIYSIATTSLMDDNSINLTSEINDLYKNINLLQSNMDKIVEASKQLSDGTNQMDAGITEANTKIQEATKKYQYYRNLDQNSIKEEIIKIVEDNINKITPALEEEITNEASKLIKENKEDLENAVITSTKKNTKEVVEEEVNKIISDLDIENIMEKTINSDLYNLLKNDSEIEELTTILKDNIRNELQEIVLNELNKLYDSVDNNMSEIQKEDITFIVDNYGLTEEQAKEIVYKIQGDTLNQVKKNINERNISDEIINALNENNYISTLINNYINKLGEELRKSLENDTAISEYSNEIKDKIISSIKNDLEKEDIYLNIDVKNYISEWINRIVDETAKDLSSKNTEDYTNQVVKNIIEKQFREENVDSKLREILDTFNKDINQKINTLDNTVNTLQESFNKLNSGSKQIANGMGSLSLGLDRYNKEGINQINRMVNGDVKSLQQRLDALKEISMENRTIDTTPSGASNSSKIIFMIDSASKPKDTHEDKTIKETKDSIWDKIKGLFK